MRLDPFHLPTPASSAKRWQMGVFCVAAIGGVAMWLGVDFTLALFGILAGEALRALQEIQAALLCFIRRARAAAGRRAAAVLAAVDEMLRLSIETINGLSRQLAAIPLPSQPLIAAALRAGNDNIVHLALSARLLPAPVPAR